MSALPDALQADLDATGAVSRFVQAGELRLHVLDYGGDGPVVLMLPGITSSAISVDFIARELAGEAHVIAADLRGRGLSDVAPDGSYSLEAYADDVAALVSGLELDRPVVVGHSLGARVAAAFAVRHPQMAGPLLLVDPPLSGPGRGPYPTTRELFLTQLHEAQAGTTGDDVARHWPSWPRREQELRARWLSRCDEQAVVETHRGFETEDFLDWWPSVPTPALLVRGGRSAVVPDSGERELAQARPDIPIAVVDDTGHMIPWDDLEGFLAVVRGFLAQAASRDPHRGGIT